MNIIELTERSARGAHTHTSTYIYRWGLTVDMTGPKKTDRGIERGIERGSKVENVLQSGQWLQLQTGTDVVVVATCVA